MQPDKRGAHDGPKQLCREVGSKLGKITVAYCEADRHRGIQMRIAASARNGCKNARHHREGPPSCNRHPAAALCFRTFKQHGGDDAIAKQDKNHRPEKFTEYR